MTRILGVPAYLGVTGALTAAMPAASPSGRHLLMVLVSVIAVIPVLAVIRGLPPAERRPYALFACGMGLLLLNNLVAWLAGLAIAAPGNPLVAAGHVVLLVAAVCLVLRRGRNDVGGLIDAAVVAIVVAAILWSALLQPGLNAARMTTGRQTTVLATVLLLAGLLGALVRLVQIAADRSPALLTLVAAVVFDLAANAVTMLAAGPDGSASPPGAEMLFMICYLLVGLAMMLPGASRLAEAGPGPAERPFRIRVLFLTVAVTVVPMVSAIREFLGVRGDTALLTVGNLLIVVLVAIRVARLAEQREIAEAAMRHQATHDLLTGLPNRAELWRRLDAALAAGPSVVLLFCDLDGFKAVNDRLGHLAGDRLLTAVAARLREGLRDGETVARYGGDEFVLISAYPDAEERLTGHVRAAVAAPVPIAGEQVRVGASVGVIRSDGTLDADGLIRRADQAMYREKAAGRAA
ncbi:GGDEF domain-containing protein [Actinoplanes sp. NPDC023714]|uniref:GGDEF domain-containing protein n=1 Tax=Actinoplanes sp. NPDC023714 TaxID=3154322 RepID=UPI0033F720DA